MAKLTEKLRITGGKQLFGEIAVCSAKNSAVAILPAALLYNGVCRIENVPDISDVTTMIGMLTSVGAIVTKIDKTTIEIDSSNLNTHIVDPELAGKMRASYYLAGALLGRLGKAEVALPGGCNFGANKKESDKTDSDKKEVGRPINLHGNGFKALGAKYIEKDNTIHTSANETLTGATIVFEPVSVGATINIMLAAVYAKGKTIIKNAAREPHVVDVANFINKMSNKALGSDIVFGAGTDVIRIDGIEGVGELMGEKISHEIIPDQIEAGTFMILAAATGGEVMIKNVVPTHMEILTRKLRDMGVDVTEYEEAIKIKSNGAASLCGGVSVTTLPHPGFPTDLHPQMAALFSMADGTSTIKECVWDNRRFRYVDELIKMGAEITLNDNLATITGKSLHGAKVDAPDLRAGAALIIAGAAAEGVTEISSPHWIDRGYADIEGRLRKLSVKIERVFEAN